MRIKEYKPGSFQNVDEITMEDMEQMYFSVLERYDGRVIGITAPLLACMVLHHEMDKVWKLIEKFPLVDISGWTPELEKICSCKRSVLRMGKEEFFVLPMRQTTTTAFLLSGFCDFKEFFRIYREAPLKKEQMEWLEKNGDPITKNVFYDFIYHMKKGDLSQNVNKGE